MSVIVRLTVPSTSFALGETLRANAEMSIELERVVPTGGEVVPSFWAVGGDFEAFEANLEREPAIEEFSAVDVTDPSAGPRLYEVEWSDEGERFVGEVVGENARLLTGVGSGGEWTFELRFPDQRAVEAFQRRCRERGIDFEVQRLYAPSEWESRDSVGLTEKQRRALTTALERGYFDVPRAASLEDLGTEFGVSRQAVSERLRRGQSELLRNVLDSEPAG